MVFATLWNRIKETVKKMLGMSTTIEQTLNIVPAISNKMVEAIDLWTDMYENNAPWLHEPTYNDPTLVVSLGLPSFIASEKARMAVIELKSEITAPTESVEKDNPEYFPPTSDEFGNIITSGKPKTIVAETPTSPTQRAEFMNKAYKEKLLPKLRTQLELGIAKGSLIIKPYVIKSKPYAVNGIAESNTKDEKDVYTFDFDFIQADCFYPFSFNSNGELIEVAFIQTKVDKDKTYTRLEYHKLSNNQVTIINRAFESTANTTDATNMGGTASLGTEIELSKVPEWKGLPPKAVVKNVSKLLFGYFKMPEANVIDPHSPLGVSGFARAEKLIREADKQYSRLLWEYEAGEMAIDIDRDALQFIEGDGTDGHSVLNNHQKRLYRKVDLGASNTFQPYSPALRDVSIINGLNNILMRIEDVCALSRGTLSDVAAEARTATELKILKQRSYSSNFEIQQALENALRDVISAMNVYCTLYNIVDDIVVTENGVDTSKLGLYDVSFTWDDSILVDVDSELSKRLTLMQSGLTSKEEVRMWYFGESERQAKEALQKISEENRSAMEDNMAMASQMGQEAQKKNPNNKETDEE